MLISIMLIHGLDSLLTTFCYFMNFQENTSFIVWVSFKTHKCLVSNASGFFDSDVPFSFMNLIQKVVLVLYRKLNRV